MKLGIFGGTFNPIHLGHLRVAEEVRMTLGLEKIIFIPSYFPPHKDLEDNVPGDKRLEIVRIGISGNPHFGLSSFEVDSGGNSYSIRTIEHIRRTYSTTPYFIMGQDAFNDILTWFEKDRLFGLTHFAVMSRPHAKRPLLGEVIGEHAAHYHATKKGFINDAGKQIVFVDVTQLDISSSTIRAMCKTGKSIRYLVPAEVEEYIREERIYV